MARKMSKSREKICNICGEDVLVYTVIDNAPLREKCVPMKQQKKIMAEAGMVQKILGVEK